MSERIYSFTLPWPSKRLARWYKPRNGSDAADDRHRAECWSESNAYKAIRSRHPLVEIQLGDRVELDLVFVPPNMRKRNVFALVDRMGPALEGICRYCAIEPCNVRLQQRLAKCPTPRGQVLCHLKVFHTVKREAIQEDLFGVL